MVPGEGGVVIQWGGVVREGACLHELSFCTLAAWWEGVQRQVHTHFPLQRMAEKSPKGKREVVTVAKPGNRIDARASAIEAALRLGFICQQGTVGLPKVVLYGFIKDIFDLNPDGQNAVKSDRDSNMTSLQEVHKRPFFWGGECHRLARDTAQRH